MQIQENHFWGVTKLALHAPNSKVGSIELGGWWSHRDYFVVLFAEPEWLEVVRGLGWTPMSSADPMDRLGGHQMGVRFCHFGAPKTAVFSLGDSYMGPKLRPLQKCATCTELMFPSQHR